MNIKTEKELKNQKEPLITKWQFWYFSTNGNPVGNRTFQPFYIMQIENTFGSWKSLKKLNISYNLICSIKKESYLDIFVLCHSVYICMPVGVNVLWYEMLICVAS